ncbi:MAG: UDP-glycosyltransferase [Flavobacterium sp.]|nr:UDP-glycosyltransferase [Flavobacterium sp.]MBP8157687.1 UDP-glycosyltransferase [Flavobacterium sp.]
MQNKKIFILLPDGIGLRNFAFTDFYKTGIDSGYNITFWNNTPFDLSDLGFSEIRIDKAKSHPLTDMYKNALKRIELNQNIKKAKDSIYHSYHFTPKINSLKSFLKSSYTKSIVLFNSSENGLKRVRAKIGALERKTKLYHDSLETLKTEKPALVFCTNQRVMLGVAPLLAAQDLGIPTACFIFSWDNLPKGTKIIETDFYFVWSQHMKDELLYYYPHIKENQIIITGTPQFESHFDSTIIQSKEAFYQSHQLDVDKTYCCFSGDDVTTSPNDPSYLEDAAKAVRSLNQKGHNLGIIFRRCPVDFSKRYDIVLAKYADCIKAIEPKWIKKAEMWNTILPTKADLELQVNTIKNTAFVINLGSSMVFDYVIFKKPCAFINYDVMDGISCRLVKDTYNLIHFRSMPSKDCVSWINCPEELETVIEKLLTQNNHSLIENATRWFEKINQHPAQNASDRIWKAMASIIAKNS